MERSNEKLRIASQEELVDGIDPKSHDIMSFNKCKVVVWISKFNRIMEKWRVKREHRRNNKKYGIVKRRAKEDIQIMEYEGTMYVCYRGIPIVREEDLGSPWARVIEHSRESYSGWLYERELDKQR